MLPPVPAEPLDTEDLILLILSELGDPSGFRGITRLEKLLFLITQEGKLGPNVKSPEFLAYKYGPFSKDVYDAVEFLRSIELVQPEEQERGSADELVELSDLDPDTALAYEPKTFSLTDSGRTVASKLADRLSPDARRSIDSVVREYGRMPLSQLIRNVYSRYPEFTSKSLIRQRVLGQ